MNDERKHLQRPDSEPMPISGEVIPYGRHSKLADDLFPSAYSPRGTNVVGSGIDAVFSKLDRISRPVISFVAGSPDPAGLPLNTLRQLGDKLFSSGDSSILNYGIVEGEYELRGYIAAKFRSEGVPVSEDNVAITNSGIQGIDLVCRFCASPGDRIIVESPAYSNTLAAVINNQAVPVPVEMDSDGIRVEDVEAELESGRREGLRTPLIVVNPTFQNPSGVSMSRRRRLELLELAHKYDCVIIEDDPYRELRFAGTPTPMLLAFDSGSHVVFTTTYSKIIAPGIRVGYVVAAKGVIGRLAKVRTSVDNGANVPAQRLVLEYCREGYIGPQIERLKANYHHKKDVMYQSLLDRFGTDERVKWTNPEGGFFIWLTLEPEVVTEDLLDYAIAEGVAFVPGGAFYIDRPKTNSLRLSYSYPNDEQIREGVEMLGRALEKYRQDKLG